MDNWVLSVELNGEWEECSFATRKEAIATFVALAADYASKLKGAVLTANQISISEHANLQPARAADKYIN